MSLQLVRLQEALTTFPVDDFVPLLVGLLNAEHSPDMMLFAARALTFLADVLPSSCNAIVGYNAVPAFCTRLLNIEYIDLAEQSLQALGKIAQEHPSACLEAGGMCAVLSFLDFFPTSMQHIAVVTAANMAHGAGPSCMDQVKDAVPILSNLLQHHDPKVVDNSCLALSRLAGALAKSPSNLEDVCSKSLVEQVLQLVTLTESGAMTTNLSVSTYFGLVKLLATCASALPMVAETLLVVSRSLFKGFRGRVTLNCWQLTHETHPFCLLPFALSRGSRPPCGVSWRRLPCCRPPRLGRAPCSSPWTSCRWYVPLDNSSVP